MKRLAIVCLSALACTALANAQEKKEYPQQERMTPGMSEYWTPQPKIVTPGDQATAGAPSDAIVLFDGKDLSAWQSAKGGPAEWDVHDGVFTVNKSKGDIQTKQSFGSFQHRHKPGARQLRHLHAEHV